MNKAKQTNMAQTPIALTIAGSDSGGGAGIQADLKSFAANYTYGASVITALTAQNTQGVQGIYPIPADFIRQQIQSIIDDFIIGAVKIGMVADTKIMHAIRDSLANITAPIVFDPVMVAQSGDRLLTDNAIDALKTIMLPISHLITPNLHEAAVLCVCEPQDILDDIHQSSIMLYDMIARDDGYILIKGGHILNSHDEYAVDYFYDGKNITELKDKRHEANHNHGTGCSLSSAITAYLVQGKDMLSAVKAAKQFVNHAIYHAQSDYYGLGNNPIDHFYHYKGKII